MNTQVRAQAPRSCLQVDNLWVRKGGVRGHKWILKDVSFEVKQGEFVAIIGPNGAGKTKLLEAILGDRPFAGQVRFYNQNLYANPEHWLQHIGWVPSYNVLHDTLRAEQALLLIAHLRLPGRSEVVIRERIQKLLNQLEFPESRRNALIRDLSSGERKRLDLCAELLTNPPLLILDEPTTNLDPDAERALMEMLRNRSWGKRQTVVVVTHTLQSLHLCDQVLFMAHGRIRSQGTSRQVLEQLKSELSSDDQPSQVSLVEDLSFEAKLVAQKPRMISEIRDDASRWAEIYRKSSCFESEAMGELPDKNRREVFSPKPARSRQKKWLHEFTVLLKRNWLLFMNNLGALGLYLLLGPFSGLLSRIVLRDNAFIQDSEGPAYSSVFDTTDARQAVFIVALVVTLLGLIGSFLDITKERSIYRYERVKGLSAFSYLLSKWLVLVFLVGILAPSFLLVVLVFQGQYLPFAPNVLVTLYLACIAAVSLGLAISAAASSERTATGLLGIAVVFHLFFSGGVDFNERFRILLDRISVFAASHWAAQGISTSIQLYCWSANPRFQDFASLGHLLSVWFFLIAYILVALLAGFIALRMQDSWYPPTIRFGKALFNRNVWLVLLLLVVALSWGKFLETRSEEYFALRIDQDNIRILNYSDRNQFQSINGYLSQSMCPVATPLPPPATPMIALPPTPLPTVTNSSAVSTTATALPTVSSELMLSEAAVQSLPVGVLILPTAIFFGPEHPGFPLEILPAGASVVILGKDFNQQWFRVKEDFTGRELVGWVPAGTVNLPASQAGGVAHPPACAIPRAYLEGNGSTPAVEWESDVSGHIVTVIDLFREEAGVQVSASKLLLTLNGINLDEYPVGQTRQAFIFRGLSIDIRLNQGNQVRFFLSEAPLPGVLLRLRASIFFVPGGCSFNSEAQP